MRRLGLLFFFLSLACSAARSKQHCHAEQKEISEYLIHVVCHFASLQVCGITTGGVVGTLTFST